MARLLAISQCTLYANNRRKARQKKPLYASIPTLLYLLSHPQNELFQRRLVPGILKPGSLRLDRRIGIVPSYVHGFLHLSPHLFLSNLVLTGNLADDSRRTLLFSLRVHFSISFVCVSAKGNGNDDTWNEVFLLALLIMRWYTVEICRIRVIKDKKIPHAPKEGAGMVSAFIDHYFQNPQQPPLLVNREILKLPGNGAALLARCNIQHISEKLVGIALERVGYGDKGVELWRFETTLDIADIFGRQINHLCKLRLRETTGLPCFLYPSAHFLSVHTIPPYRQ